MGAFCFSSFTLAPGEKTDFILLSGIADSKEEIENIFEKYNTSDKVKNAHGRNQNLLEKTGKR